MSSKIHRGFLLKPNVGSYFLGKALNLGEFLFNQWPHGIQILVLGNIARVLNRQSYLVQGMVDRSGNSLEVLSFKKEFCSYCARPQGSGIPKIDQRGFPYRLLYPVFHFFCPRGWISGSFLGF